MKHRAGFSLIELAIVLVVIGLIIGAILMGMSMIRASELQSVMIDTQKYISATQTFQEKYKELPGDMSDATSYWGEVAAGCTTAQGTGTQTCNGDGSGKLGLTVSDQYETFRFWQHLANAGMIEGQFTGVDGPAATGQDAVPGVNVPTSKLKDAGFTMMWRLNNYPDTINIWGGKYGHVLHFGRHHGSTYTYAPVLSPIEARQLDMKSDDGRPGMGSIRSMKGTSTFTPGCTTTGVAATAEYVISENVLCNLILITGF